MLRRPRPFTGDDAHRPAPGGAPHAPGSTGGGAAGGDVDQLRRVGAARPHALLQPRAGALHRRARPAGGRGGRVGAGSDAGTRRGTDLGGGGAAGVGARPAQPGSVAPPLTGRSSRVSSQETGSSIGSRGVSTTLLGTALRIRSSICSGRSGARWTVHLPGTRM